jgi:methanol metabolism-related c-type cytochrome
MTPSRSAGKAAVGYSLEVLLFADLDGAYFVANLPRFAPVDWSAGTQVAFKQVSDLTSGSPGTDITAALVSDGVELGRRLISLRVHYARRLDSAIRVDSWQERACWWGPSFQYQPRHKRGDSMPIRRWLAFPLATALAVFAGAQFDAHAAQQVANASTAAPEAKPYKIEKDGTVDWATYNGYRRFNSICETCHGFDGVGSSFGPNLVDSLKRMSHDQFVNTVVNGKQDVNTAQTLVMPAFGTNPNVMCYLDDIYTYLKARADGALGRGRPAKHAPKPQSATDAENACMG